MINICMFIGIVGKNRKHIEKLLFYANNKPAMLICHLGDIIFSEFKLIDFSLFYCFLPKGFFPIVSPTQI